ncbi:hypothetical protein DFH29DRAFT_877092 [Suillus ampliporus]|nr:hypothetical protein DFH29DRAFT_877092 [Suillus ampliporus]
MRAQNMLKAVEARLEAATSTYKHAHKALVGESEGTRKLSWIWNVQGAAPDKMDKDNAFEARAQAMCWAEEVELLKEEMRRILQFFEWDAQCWDERGLEDALQNADDDDKHEGLITYAKRQASLHQRVYAKVGGHMGRQVHDASWCISTGGGHTVAAMMHHRLLGTYIYLGSLTIVQVSEEMIPCHIELYEEPEEDLTALPLLENHQDLPDHEDSNGGYYMGGVGGGLGLGLVDEHLRQLESLAHDDKPDITLSTNENAVGLDHAGLVVWEFSDGNDLDGNDSDMPDKW